MKISQQGIDFIKKAEGCFHWVYLDSGGAPTIGIGHLLTQSERRSGKIIIGGEAVKYLQGLTEAQVEQLLVDDLAEVEGLIDVAVKIPLYQWQYDALVSFVFNVGNNAFKRSTLLRNLNAGLYTDIPQQLRRWVHDNGMLVVGLVNRREAEIKLWKNEWVA